tara:strand:- start:2764 stop:4662 length:1899 start_codon:yes stop_codon:yes gene_type:complete
MPLTKLQFRPGINRELTSYTNEGGWYDGNKIRFRAGVPEKIGGWVKAAQGTYIGSARALHSFTSLAGAIFTGIGTHLKYYLLVGETLHDITPVRKTSTTDDIFAATDGESTIVVTDNAHGAVKNDFVTFAGAAALGGSGNITATVLNQEYQVAKVVSANVYHITAKDTSGDTVVANANDTGDGGTGTTAAYQVNVGLDTVVYNVGWGTDTWGRDTWDSDGTLGVLSTLRLWSHDNFGEDLIYNVRNGGIFYWDTSAKAATYGRGVSLNSLTNADSGTPTIAKKIIVSDRDRHIIAFGCDAETSIGTQDPLLIRFSGQESATTWNATATNTAGDLPLSTGSEIVTAIETRQQILVFTDVSLHAMQFLGPPFTFGIGMISENITIMGPNVAKAVDDTVFWMGVEDFYIYDGRVRKLPCSVRSYVFNDFNLAQKDKAFAGLNSTFNEIWWFYPSGTNAECDKYVVYNFLENAWTYGSLSRTAWLDRGIVDNPLATGNDQHVYFHESGLDDGSTAPASVIQAHIESSPIDAGEGNSFVFLNRLLPDITFEGSSATAPKATFTLKMRNSAGGNYLETAENNVTQSAAATSTVVEQFTEQVFIRLRGRAFSLRVESSDVETQWRLGTNRVDLKVDGKK